MSIQPPDASALALDAGSRHAVTGVLTPELGMQPYYDWLLETLHLLNESSCGALRVVADDASVTTVRVTPGRASISDVPLTVAAQTLDLASHNNDTAYVWLEDDSGSALIAAGADADGWPVSAHIKLAEVTLAAGVITSILDRRFETLFRI